MVKAFSSDAISIIANLAKLKKYVQDLLLSQKRGKYNDFLLARLRLYQGIQKEKPYFAERIDIRDYYRVFVVEPKSEHRAYPSSIWRVSSISSHHELDSSRRYEG